MADCYYLSTNNQSDGVNVHRYSDDVIVKNYQEADWKMSEIHLIGITDSLVVVVLSNLNTSFVYSFDCFDPHSFKRCYVFNVDWSVIDTGFRYSLDDKLVVAMWGEECIRYVAWKFSDTSCEKISEWTLPVQWADTSIIKLSNNQLLSFQWTDVSTSPFVMYLTTINDDASSGTLSTTIASSRIDQRDLDRLGVGMISKIIDRFSIIRYYPNHQMLLAYADSRYALYRRSTEWKLIKSDGCSRMAAKSIIDGKLRIIQDGKYHKIVTLPEFEPVPTLEALSRFYACPTKARIEQIYLPLLLPAFKGCKDLALLVTSYLEWHNDIVN